MWLLVVNVLSVAGTTEIKTASKVSFYAKHANLKITVLYRIYRVYRYNTEPLKRIK
jgi:hypothetical protein